MLFAEQAATYRNAFVGQTASVLWEATSPVNGSGWRLEGWTGNYIRVTACAPEPRWNVMDTVDLTGTSANGLNGVIRNSG